MKTYSYAGISDARPSDSSPDSTLGAKKKPRFCENRGLRACLLDLSCFRVGACHPQTKLLPRDFAGRHGRDDLPAVHHRDAVRERHDLVEFGGDQQHSHAPVAHGDNFLVDVFDGAHIQAAGRLVGNQQFHGAAEFARHDHFLLVPAGELSDRIIRRGSSHIIFVDEFDGIRFQNLRLDDPVFAIRRVIIIAQDHVIDNGVAQHQPVPLAVFWNVRQTCLR